MNLTILSYMQVLHSNSMNHFPTLKAISLINVPNRLTGYNRAELIGRNCRFLQDPSGIVIPGTERKFTDNNAVHRIKQHMKTFQEGTFTLINYKKNGEPFMNHLTLIPLSLDLTGKITHFVGLQIDLISQPLEVIENMKNGSYQINYRTHVPPPKPSESDFCISLVP